MNVSTVRPKISLDVEESLKSYPPLMRELLFQRGIFDYASAERFLNPSFEQDTHDPYLMKDMEKAVVRILAAIDRGEKIVIYSDYDADGIPGAVVMHDFFGSIGFKNFEIYIPHRHTEGYGLSSEAISELAKREARLLITIDCGISDHGEVEHANSLGIDVIITDHHEPHGAIPAAFAIVNPKQPDCSYPYSGLCGSGVIFKLIQAILIRNNFGLKAGKEKWLLDMVGLATLADMVPLRGENRVLAFYGLKVLRKSPRVGLMKLLRKINVNQYHLTEDDVGFTIAPRINAASRMDVPMDAFHLLSTRDEILADTLSTHLNKINDERKGLVAAIVREAKKTITARGKESVAEPVLVIGNPEWRPSLLGLVANSLAEEFEKPAFVWGRGEGETLKGSCRSDGMTDLVLLMEKAKDVFLDFGGHKLSGGFSIAPEIIHTLSSRLKTAYESISLTMGAVPVIIPDMVLTLDDISWDTWRIIEQLAPFGIENQKPLFIFERVEIVSVRQFGRDKNHLELGFLNSRGAPVRAIKFFADVNEFALAIEQGMRINLLATMEKSVFRDVTEVRLRIVDVVTAPLDFL